MDLAWVPLLAPCWFLKLCDWARSDGTCSLEQLWLLSDLFEISWCFSIFPATEGQTETQAENKSLDSEEFWRRQKPIGIK